MLQQLLLLLRASQQQKKAVVHQWGRKPSVCVAHRLAPAIQKEKVRNTKLTTKNTSARMPSPISTG